MSASAIVSVACLVALFFAPAAAFLLVAINATAAALVLCFQFSRASLLPSAKQDCSGKDYSPFVSVHVPTYDEPPEIVIQTLDALANLDYDNFEVIVLDNNTPSEATWKPVERHCARLGERFQFHHFDNVQGAKAGALNLCLGLMNPDTEAVAVVDADYVVTPTFLRMAASQLADTNVSFVQFPQAYRGGGVTTKGIELELEEYFRSYAVTANATQSMLLTGTLSVVRADKLRAVGSWSGKTITEDAELGTRLWSNGYCGRYFDCLAGSGLLPMSISDLEAQRHRWVVGNLQTLAANRSLWFRWVAGQSSVLAQLTAWPVFWLLPIVNLLAMGVASLFEQATDPIHNWIVVVSTYTLLLSFIGFILRTALIAYRRDAGFSALGQAVVAKLALCWISSKAVFDVMRPGKITFVRTPKIAAHHASLGIQSLPIVSAASCMATLGFAVEQNVPATIACGLIVASWVARRSIDRSLSAYACGWKKMG